MASLAKFDCKILLNLKLLKTKHSFFLQLLREYFQISVEISQKNRHWVFDFWNAGIRLLEEIISDYLEFFIYSRRIRSLQMLLDAILNFFVCGVNLICILVCQIVRGG